MIPKRLCNEAEARKHSGAFVDLYGQLLMKGDPLADAFAVDVERLGHKTAMRMLDTALDHGIGAVPDAPDSLVRLFAQVDDVREDPLTVGIQRLRRRLKPLRRPGRHDDACARLDGGPRGLQADADAYPGDDDDLLRQEHRHS